MPMTNDSADTSFFKDVKSKGSKLPRQSSLAFIRQFARIYINCGSPLLGAIIAN